MDSKESQVRVAVQKGEKKEGNRMRKGMRRRRRGRRRRERSRSKHVIVVVGLEWRGRASG